ncbi:MAG: hypothetical protein AYP45_16435 [Candidatus Brocadia carolinensis]|uniref:Uncharacterized protein n=1 Tax=Candidatus Brocadia carolinensis TaxID=1004156 RepID=A0A1V4APZ0_9BACT|nr:MAG: hypothetical protein AYP45_16435 [Candidatus Brocadia caroliniensis]
MIPFFSHYFTPTGLNIGISITPHSLPVNGGKQAGSRFVRNPLRGENKSLFKDKILLAKEPFDTSLKTKKPYCQKWFMKHLRQ